MTGSFEPPKGEADDAHGAGPMQGGCDGATVREQTLAALLLENEALREKLEALTPPRDKKSARTGVPAPRSSEKSTVSFRLGRLILDAVEKPLWNLPLLPWRLARFAWRETRR